MKHFWTAIFIGNCGGLVVYYWPSEYLAGPTSIEIALVTIGMAFLAAIMVLFWVKET